MHSWEGDPQQPQPTPDFGDPRPTSELAPDRSIDPRAGGWRVLFAIGAGILLALVFATGKASATWQEIEQILGLQGKPQPASPGILSQHEIESLDRQSPQSQAQLLLERAINGYEGADCGARGWLAWPSEAERKTEFTDDHRPQRQRSAGASGCH
jgi:hypothetical protein